MEKVEAVPTLSSVHKDYHAAARLDTREGDGQLRGLQARGFAVLAIRGNLVGTEDTTFACDQIELLTRSDLSREEVFGVRVLRRDVGLGDAEVCSQHGDVRLDQSQATISNQALDSVILGGESDADDLGVPVDLQRRFNETAGRASQGEHAGPLARQGKDTGGLLHLGSDTLHHAQEDLARVVVRVISDVPLSLEVSVALWIVPALWCQSNQKI